MTWLGRWTHTEKDQLFLSWPASPAALAGRIPAPLSLDSCDGRAWITLVALRLEGLRLRGLPPIPGASRFAEVGVMTYVRRGDERGVWYLRIDAATRCGCVVGRAYGLPYRRAAVTVEAEGDWRRVRCVGRATGGAAGPALDARYRPRGPEREARPGTLDHFLVEPLVLFARTTGGRLLRGAQARPPRRIRACEVILERNTLLEAAGLAASPEAPVAWSCGPAVVETAPPAPVAPGSVMR